LTRTEGNGASCKERRKKSGGGSRFFPASVICSAGNKIISAALSLYKDLRPFNTTAIIFSAFFSASFRFTAVLLCTLDCFVPLEKLAFAGRGATLI